MTPSVMVYSFSLTLHIQSINKYDQLYLFKIFLIKPLFSTPTPSSLEQTTITSYP